MQTNDNTQKKSSVDTPTNDELRALQDLANCMPKFDIKRIISSLSGYCN
jgi:hypothetical protein